MELQINSNVENKLFQRKEIKFTLDAEITPSREQIKVELCKKLSLSPDSTMVVNVDQLFGSKTSVCTAHSYHSKELMLKFEPKYLVKRVEKAASKAAGAEAKPAEAAPAAEEAKKE